MRTARLNRVLSAASLALAAGFCLAPPAQAGVFDDDEARKAILDLRAQVDALQSQMNQRIQKLENAQAGQIDLANQIESMRQDIDKLRGSIEVLNNQLANLDKRQKDFYTDLDTRLRKLEPQQVTVDGKEGTVDPGEQRAFDAALNQFKGGDYKGAVSSFQAFMRQYPDSVYAASAEYWIGTGYYLQKDYKAAIAAQQTVVKNWPDSPRAADALLNIASSQNDMGDKKAAKKTLESVVANYPDSQAAGAAKERLASR